MNTIELADQSLCTGCGACAARCPKHCISMRENAVGIVLPVIDTTACIGCHTCEKACPILKTPEPHKPSEAYAAWSSDGAKRVTSASGGVAIEMYKHAVANGYAAVGASQNDDFSVTHKLVTSADGLGQFKNSKYVFSDAYDAFADIKKALRESRKVIFIGLPCQVAALRKLFRDDSLLLVDLVCHGTTPLSYLRQHIGMLSRQAGKVAKRMSFRDPAHDTCKFTLTLYDIRGKFYAKRTKDGDTYQFGYHRAVSYRENCYHCRFACAERQGDITIADYHGLGLCAPASFSSRKVSLVLINTGKGKAFVEELVSGGRVHVEPRPLEEPFKGEPQLRHPSVKSKYRMAFEKEIVRHGGDFEQAIKRLQRKYMAQMRIVGVVSLPKKILRKVKKTIIG